ncbi:cholesterol oxidase substrate-binding domain-containing protein [Streptomyces sp. NPDC006476]|uniref:cholesterol oxidase substrate-binding domain-containing protein n=1 Tax=Streptomyces sp. NPDC006476 TaxID=3157175 RepID=UPI0033BB6FE4
MGRASDGAWIDRTTIPDAYRARQPHDDNWDTAVATLRALDPAGVLTSVFRNKLMG